MNIKLSIIVVLVVLSFINSNAQDSRIENLAEYDTEKDIEGIYESKFAGDDKVSSFILKIDREVKMHYHKYHSEHIYVLSGEADFYLDDKWHKIKAGDFIFIPPGKPHSLVVTSDDPLKVISVQAPEFTGEDRIWIK